jgi:hypothetical protein
VAGLLLGPLLAFLAYMAILHVRLGRLIGKFGVAAVSIVAFQTAGPSGDNEPGNFCGVNVTFMILIPCRKECHS